METADQTMWTLVKNGHHEYSLSSNYSGSHLVDVSWTSMVLESALVRPRDAHAINKFAVVRNKFTVQRYHTCTQ